MVKFGILLCFFALGVLGFTGNLLSYSKKIKNHRDYLMSKTDSLSPAEKGERQYYKINDYIYKYFWILFFIGAFIALTGLIIDP